MFSLSLSFSSQGIVRALEDFKHKLIEHKVTIFVRRGGPNYQEGLRVMREAGSKLEIPLHVFGPETHMTAVVGMALGKRPLPKPSPGLAPQNVSTCTSIQNVISFKLKMPLKARSCSLHPFLLLSLSSSIFCHSFSFLPLAISAPNHSSHFW